MLRTRVLMPLAAAFTLGLMGVGPAFAETITVTVENMEFTPAEIAAKVGDTVEWVNKDPVDHTATVKDGWDVMLPAGESGSVTLETAGEFDYFCRFHPNMLGRITVSAE